MSFINKNKIWDPLTIGIWIVAVIGITGLIVFIFISKPENVIVNEEDNQEESGEIIPGIWRFSLAKPVFAQAEGGLSEIAASIPFGKVSISEIENLSSFSEEENIQFSEAQKQALEDYGFFLVENNIIEDQSGWADKDDFIDTYDFFDGSYSEYYRTQNNAIFISSDLALHLYHILIDRTFQKIEESKFQPMLRSMTKVLFLDSVNRYNSADDEKLKESYKRLSAYYLIPLVILDAGSNSAGVDLKPEDYSTFAQYLGAIDDQRIANSEQDLIFSLDDNVYDGIELDSEIYSLAKSELELIQKAEGLAFSPLFTPFRQGFMNDYSQFTPRSHYTKNDILKSYFISMMWYGRMGFIVKSPELTRDALIITGQINNLKVNDEELSQMWSDMSAVIDFFVGEVDDLTAYEYSSLIEEVYGNNISDKNFTNDELLEEFISRAKEELPAPKIVSEALWVFDDSGHRNELLADTKQFRFMGQRFTPDAYIINNLTQGIGSPDPETGQMLPTMPTALMPIHVIEPDNQIVKDYLYEWINDPVRIQKQDRQSDKVLAKVVNMLISEFFGYQESVWTQNIYWSWLNCFKPLLAGYGAGYPYFMQRDEWLKKNLGTVLGSYTELKHDTLLYAKQSYAEMGGAGGDELPPLPPVVKGYVEPDLVFWNRIIALAEMTEKGLNDRGLLPGYPYDSKFRRFIESAEFLRDMAEKELINEKISDEDFEKLRVINGYLGLGYIVEPIGGQELTKKEKRAGIIADIHTDAVFGEVLYEATGKPFIVYVAVKDINGTRLTRGVVFNHYEFESELDGGRLSDEDWQSRVYDGRGQMPVIDQWSSELIK